MTLLNRVHGFPEAISPGELVVKSCGIMRPEHALAANKYGSNMVGLVFARSRRTVSNEAASSIRHAIDRLGLRPLLVGVFVNERPPAIIDIADSVGLDVVQLSGDETPAEVAACAERYPVLKALRFAQGSPPEVALEELGHYRALVSHHRLRFIVDTYHAGEYGGTGITGEWRIAARLAAREKIMLAGGLTPRNVARAVKEVAPWGVDVSSGIEREGVKDTHLIKVFNANARRIQVQRQSGR